MAVAVILPKLDEAMTSGKIARWLKKEGDRVEKGEGILEIETEKVTFEAEAEASGVLSKVMASAGEDVPVGATIAFILQQGEKIPEVPQPTATAKAEAEAEVSPVTKGAETIEVKASPLAKRIAREHNIDLSRVKGTGPFGRIVREDVERAIEESKAVPTPSVKAEPEVTEEETVALSSMREVIARRMTESFRTPHFYITVEVDAQELVKTRERLMPVVERKIGIRLTVTDLLVKMVAKALEDNPVVNCAYVDGGVRLFKRIDIGVVTAVEGGLLVPVIRRANKKSLSEIVQARNELVQKARDGKLALDEMRGSTFTISNAGMYEVDHFSAILQPPEAAILAVGRIADRAVVRNGQVIARPTMMLTLSIDHRVLDAVIGAGFQRSLKNYIENPATMLL